MSSGAGDDKVEKAESRRTGSSVMGEFELGWKDHWTDSMLRDEREIVSTKQPFWVSYM